MIFKHHGNQEIQPRNVDKLENLDGWNLKRYIEYMDNVLERHKMNLYGKVKLYQFLLTGRMFPVPLLG